jgi:hypothetical protein
MSHAACGGDGQLYRDVWWKWTAVCDGVVTMDTCLSGSSFNTKIAVYAPLAPCAPPTEHLIACSDDSCGVRSSVSFVAIGGQQYLIRVGMPSGAASGNGTLRVACAALSICSIESGYCQGVDYTENAEFSDRTYKYVDSFIAPTSGQVDSLCWRGGETAAPLVDAFTVRYWTTGSDGRPDTPVSAASFSQADGTLVVRRRLTGQTLPGGTGIDEEEYSASHSPVIVQKGEKYWVEIRLYDTGGSTPWYWAAGTGGDGIGYRATHAGLWTTASERGDRAFCVGFQSFCEVDTNGDGVINFADLNNIVSIINTACP